MARLRDLEVGGGVIVPEAALSVRFSRSGGPGGQHVNKVETRVELRLDLAAAEAAIGTAKVVRIRENLGARIIAADALVVVCDEHRSQLQNLRVVLDRMEQMLCVALRPKKRRRATRPTRGSRERRLKAKRERGEVKRRRSDRDGEG